MRVGARRCYVCLLIGLCNREIVGRAAGERKDARLARSAFAALGFSLDDMEVFHADRGPELNNAAIDELLDVFGIKRSPSAKGCPYDSSVDRSANKMLKAGSSTGSGSRRCASFRRSRATTSTGITASGSTRPSAA